MHNAQCVRHRTMSVFLCHCEGVCTAGQFALNAYLFYTSLTRPVSFRFPVSLRTSDRGAPRSESELIMIAGGNHTLISVTGVAIRSLVGEGLDPPGKPQACAMRRIAKKYGFFGALRLLRMTPLWGVFQSSALSTRRLITWRSQS